MTKAERKKKFVAECRGPYPHVVTSAGQWFEVVNALEAEGSTGLVRIANQIRKQCTEQK